MNDHTFIALTRADNVRPGATGLLADLHGGPRPEQLRIDVLRPDVVRIKISRGGRFDESPTFAVRSDLEAPPVPVEVTSTSEAAVVATSALRVTVSLDPFRIDAHRPDGTVVFETARSGDGFATYATLNDAFTLSRASDPDEAIYGLGEKTGPHNRKGHDYAMWNVDVLNPTSSGEFTAGRDVNDPRADNMSTSFDPYYISIPWALHRNPKTGRMSASFIDNGYRGAYDFRERHRSTYRFEGGQYTEYVFAGPDLRDILEAYTWLTGRTQLPPLWSLGYHQCRWHEYRQQDVLAIAETLRRRGIPCDSLWLDIEYMDGYRVFTWNRDLFPDAEEMLGTLSEEGFRVVTIIDPGVKAEPGYPVYDDALAKDVLCRTEGDDVYIGQVWPGDTAFPDFVTEEGRSWWGALNAEHVRSGIAGIWNDMNEPATGSIDPMRMRFGRGRYSHERYHNQYAMLMAMGTVEGLTQAMPEQRTFVLSRAGSAGIQRYAANWMGDNVANWDHLRMSITMACGLGLSGQSFVGADIGGFAEDTDSELFARWVQYAALTPFCRNHSAIHQRDQYPWSFGTAVESITRDALQLRYRLLPYLYSAFVEAATTGAPVQRPLVFDFQYDRAVTDLDDQYLFGPHLLVAPVLAEGATQRTVYLPEGTWYDWHTAAALTGERHVVAEAPLDRIPLYARGGSVVPMLAEAPLSTAGLAPTSIELHVFVPADGAAPVTSFLQEDDGETFAAGGGALVHTRFTVQRHGAEVTVTAAATGEGFPRFRRQEFVVVVHGGVPADVRLRDADSAAPPVQGCRVPLAVGAEDFTLRFVV